MCALSRPDSSAAVCFETVTLLALLLKKGEMLWWLKPVLHASRVILLVENRNLRVWASSSWYLPLRKDWRKSEPFGRAAGLQMRCGGNPNVLNRVPGSTHVPTFAYRCPRGGPKEATFSLSRHKVSHSILTEGLIYSRVFGGNRSTP